MAKSSRVGVVMEVIGTGPTVEGGNAVELRGRNVRSSASVNWHSAMRAVDQAGAGQLRSGHSRTLRRGHGGAL